MLPSVRPLLTPPLLGLRPLGMEAEWWILLPELVGRPRQPRAKASAPIGRPLFKVGRCCFRMKGRRLIIRTTNNERSEPLIRVA